MTRRKLPPKPERERAESLSISLPRYMADAARKSGNPSRYFQQLWLKAHGKRRTAA